MATFYAASDVVTSGTVTGTETSIAYIWHPSTATKSLKLLDIDLHGFAGNAGSYTVRICKISAQNATPGGTTVTPLGGKGETAECAFRYGANAPTRGVDIYVDASSASSDHDGDFEPMGDGLFIDAGVAGGFEIRVKVEATISSGAKIAASCIWEEV